jgi:threonine dehydrogenase-like Zn-dependent dehydrogenase
MLAKAMGARVITVDVSPERLGLSESFGADVTIDPKATDPIAAIKDLTHGEGTDLALDCSASPDARIAAVRSTRAWGTVCFVGEGNNVTIDVSPDMIRKQLTILASWTFNTVGQADCARFIADRKVPVDRVFTHSFSLDQAEEAYRLFDTQTTGKGVFVF